MNYLCKGRLLRVIIILSVVLACGIAYLVFFMLTGIGIPCPFHSVTGLECPGCGITRACAAMLSLDFAAAWKYNCFSFFIIAYIAWISVQLSIKYIRKGVYTLEPKPEWLNITFLVLLIIWGVVRNII